MRCIKGYTLEMLGYGRENGGTKEHQKNRMAALEHVRRTAKLTPEQAFVWQVEIEKWDDKMAAAHKAEWGK